MRKKQNWKWKKTSPSPQKISQWESPEFDRLIPHLLPVWTRITWLPKTWLPGADGQLFFPRSQSWESGCLWAGLMPVCLGWKTLAFEHFLSETHTALSGRKLRRVKPFLLESRDQEGSQIKRIKPGGWETSGLKGISVLTQTERFLTESLVRKRSIKKTHIM